MNRYFDLPASGQYEEWNVWLVWPSTKHTGSSKECMVGDVEDQSIVLPSL